VTLTGEGFVNLDNSTTCRYSLQGSIVDYEVSAAVQSSTAVVCDSLPIESELGDYVVEVSLNGGFHYQPMRTGEPVTFTKYALDDVVVLSIDPPGGPIEGDTVVVVNGTNFAEYGDDLVGCVFEDETSEAVFVPATTLQDPLRLVCVVPAAPTSARRRLQDGTSAVTVKVSLGGGAPGTVSTSGVPFFYYNNPDLQSVTVDVDGRDTLDAAGGDQVTITGDSFRALVDANPAFVAFLRVRIGIFDAPAIVSLEDGTLSFTAPVGKEGLADVTIALNGQQFTAPKLSVTYIGFHPPVITDARFAEDAARILVTFDPQGVATGNFTGVFPCIRALNEATVATLRGSDEAPEDEADDVQCFWQDIFVLEVLLPRMTLAGPGVRIGTQARALLPFTAQVRDELYADSELAVDIDYPCGFAGPGIDACPTPTVSLNGPREISSCTTEDVLVLDASASSRGGVRDPSFRWRVDPFASDVAQDLNERLGSLAPFSQFVELQDFEGAQFRFLVEVTSFLGRTSQVAAWDVRRLAVPSPILSVDVPEVMTVRASQPLSITGQAEVASCYAGGIEGINFGWAHYQTINSTGHVIAEGPDAVLPAGLAAALADASSSPSIIVPSFSLALGHQCTLRLTASMASDPTASSVLDVTLVVATEALQLVLNNGDRVHTVSNQLVIDAGASLDPNVGPGSDGLSLALALSPALVNSTGGAMDPSIFVSGLRVVMPPGALPVETDVSSGEAIPYTFTLTLSKEGRASVSTDVVITPTTTGVPEVVITRPGNFKINPNQPLVLRGRATWPDGTRSRFDYEWSSADFDDVHAIATTASTSRNLKIPGRVIDPVLIPGASYTFTLTATARSNGAQATASTTVVMNRAPFGGTISVTPAAGVARTTVFTLDALGWTDEDLPLTYSYTRDLAALTASRTVARTQTVLPAPTTVGPTTIECTIRDAYDGTAFAKTTVDVTDEPIDSTRETEMRGFLVEFVVEGKSDLVSALISAFMRAINAQYFSVTTNRRALQDGNATDTANATEVLVDLVDEERKTEVLEALRAAQGNAPPTAASLATQIESLAQAVAIVEDINTAGFAAATDVFVFIVTNLFEASEAQVRDLASISESVYTVADRLFEDAAIANAAYDPATQGDSSAPKAVLARLNEVIAGPLSSLLLRSLVLGEPQLELSTNQIRMLISRYEALALRGAELEAPEGNHLEDKGGLVLLPDDIVESIGGTDEDEVGVSRLSFLNDPFSGADSTSQALVSSAFGLFLVDERATPITADFEDRTPMTVRLRNDVEQAANQPGDGCPRDCNSIDGRGNCRDDRCECAAGWFGPDCNQFARCSVWDDEGSRWRGTDMATETLFEGKYSDSYAQCEASVLGIYASAGKESFFPPPPSPPGSPPPPSPKEGGIRLAAVFQDLPTEVYTIVVAVIAGFNALCVVLALVREWLIPFPKKRAARAKRMARRDVALEKGRLGLFTRLRFALEDNALLVGLVQGESEPGLRLPELVFAFFTTMLAQLCAQAVYYDGVYAASFSLQPLDWQSVQDGDPGASNALLRHVTASAFLVTPVIYMIRLVFAVCFGLPWSSSPWGLVRRVFVTLYMVTASRSTKEEIAQSKEGGGGGKDRVKPVPTAAAAGDEQPPPSPRPPSPPRLNAPATIHPADAPVDLPPAPPDPSEPADGGDADEPRENANRSNPFVREPNMGERFGVGDDNIPQEPPEVGILDFVGISIGWFVNIGAFAYMVSFALFYGAEFTEKQVSAAIVSWAIAISFAFLWIEPVVIIFFTILQHLTVRVTGGI